MRAIVIDANNYLTGLCNRIFSNIIVCKIVVPIEIPLRAIIKSLKKKRIEYFNHRCDKLFKSQKLFDTDLQARNKAATDASHRLNISLVWEAHRRAAKLINPVLLTLLNACCMKSQSKEQQQCHFPEITVIHGFAYFAANIRINFSLAKLYLQFANLSE